MRERRIEPISCRTAPASRMKHGGILNLPMSNAANVDPDGTKAPKARRQIAASTEERPLTVMKRWGIWTRQIINEAPEKKVLLHYVSIEIGKNFASRSNTYKTMPMHNRDFMNLHGNTGSGYVRRVVMCHSQAKNTQRNGAVIKTRGRT